MVILVVFFFEFAKSHSPCRKKKIFDKQKKKKLDQVLTQERQLLDQVLTLQHIYVYAAKLVTGPRLGHFNG